MKGRMASAHLHRQKVVCLPRKAAEVQRLAQRAHNCRACNMRAQVEGRPASA